MSEASFTPLTDIPPEHCNLAGILPEYAQPDRIGIDYQALSRVAGWGGFYADPNRIRIRGYRGETTDYQGSVVGHSGGAALLGAVSKREASLGASGELSSGTDHFRTRRELTLRVNTSEITDRMSREQANVRSPQSWADNINLALAESMRRNAKDQLTGFPVPFIEMLAAGGLAMTAHAILVVGMSRNRAQGNETSVQGVVLSELVNVLTMIGAMSVMRLNDRLRAHSPAKDAIHSLIPVRQYDRLGLVAILSRTNRFAQVLD